MQGGKLVVIAHQFDGAVFLFDMNAGRDRHSEFALGTFDVQLIADVDFDAFGQRDRFFSYS